MTRTEGCMRLEPSGCRRSPLKTIVDPESPDPALNPRGLGALPSTNYYDMEQAQVVGYAGYSHDPQPPWDLRS
jgi:hypothetical protein